MRPRFSILTLLLITTYLGVVFAGIRQPSSYWDEIAVLAWIGTLFALLVIALGQGNRAILARGFLAAQLLVILMIPIANAGVLPARWPWHTELMHEETIQLASLISGCLGSMAVYFVCLREPRI